MEITDVKVFPVNEEKLKAFVSIVIDDCFMVNDIKIISGREGRFISMPSRRKKGGEFKDVAHPLNNETRRKMEQRILSEYDRVRGVRASTGPEVLETANKEAERTVEPVVEEPQEDNAEHTLKEVAEKHLSDAFWTT